MVFPWFTAVLRTAASPKKFGATGGLRRLADAGRSAGVEDELRRHRQDAWRWRCQREMGILQIPWLDGLPSGYVKIAIENGDL